MTIFRRGSIPEKKCNGINSRLRAALFDPRSERDSLWLQRLPRKGHVMKPPVTKYGCGHVGRFNVQIRTKGAECRKAFIRVAEIRGAHVEDEPGKCPDCEK